MTHLVLAALVALVPVTWVLQTEGVRLLWLFPLLVAACGLLAWRGAKGHVEAQILLVGALALALGEAGEYLRLLGVAAPISLPHIGFSALLLAMAAALAYRFARAHEELDHLRAGLAERVEERTAALERMTRAARDASAAKGTLLSTLSHELREPLKTVVAFSGLALREPRLPERERDFIRRVESSGRYALRLVGDLLDLSRLETGRLQVRAEDVDIQALVQDLTHAMEASALERGVTLVAEVPAGLTPVRTDPVRLRQVLINLVGNGIKFAPSGAVLIRVDATGSTPTAITVSDTGLGMSPDVLASIYDGPGNPLEAAGSREGAGIGLNISRALCELLDHTLTISSRPGEGTMATVSLHPPGESADLP